MTVKQSKPSYASLRDAAERALAGGDARQASLIAAAMIEARPREAHGHFLFGMAEAALGRVGAAVAPLQKAVDLNARPDYLAHLARLLILLKRDGEALGAADRALTGGQADALTSDTLGCVYARLGAHEKAVPLFRRAVELQPDNLEFRFNLATTLGFLGRKAEAQSAHEDILKRDPLYVKSHAVLSSLTRQTDDDNHIERLTKVLGQTRDPIGRLHIQYALAKEYEDLKRPEDSYRHLAEANSRRKAELGYDVGTDLRLGEALQAHFARDDYFTGESHVADAPIFIVGLPRTGTTLVDRILSSHAEVTSAGELQVMPVAIKRLSGTSGRFTLDAETIAAAGNIAPDAVGRLYIDASRPHHGGQGRFTDKLPLNFLYAGFIARALPNARIVCLRRNPMDSVWSNYKHLFATNFSYYNYSYDLLDTAAYYLMFDRLMAFWDSLFPGRILQIAYEDIIEDLDGQVHRLLDHCGLPFSEDCLRFHENAAPVATPSAPQVRQPLYRSSLGKWRDYERHMESVKAFFEKRGVSTGY